MVLTSWFIRTILILVFSHHLYLLLSGFLNLLDGNGNSKCMIWFGPDSLLYRKVLIFVNYCNSAMGKNVKKYFPNSHVLAKKVSNYFETILSQNLH